MFVSQTALEISNVRFLDRRVRGKLDGSPLHETSRRHDHLIFVSRHIPRFQLNKAVDG